MAKVTKIFDFTNSPQGWDFSFPSALGWNSPTDNPPSSLKAEYSIYGGINDSGVPPTGIIDGRYDYAWWHGTWNDLGVPFDVAVNSIQLISVKRMTTSLSGTESDFNGIFTSGPIEFYDDLGNLKFTLLSGRTREGQDEVDTDWNISDPGPVYNIPSELQQSTSIVELRIQYTSRSEPGGYNKSYLDDLILDVNYNYLNIIGSANLNKDKSLIATATISGPSTNINANVITKGLGYNQRLITKGYKKLFDFSIYGSASLETNNVTIKSDNAPSLFSANSVSLYISTGDLAYKPNGLNLSIKGESDNITFYYTGYGLNFQPVMSPSLYVSGKSIDVNENITTLSVSGFVPYMDKALNLFIDQRNGGMTIPLIIEGLSLDVFNSIKNLELLTSGHQTFNNNISLILYMATIAGGTVPLSISGPTANSNYTSLYIYGPNPTFNNLNLFLKTDTIPIINNIIPAYMYGGSGGLYPISLNSMSLFMEPSPPVNRYMNLYIDGVRYKVSNASSLNLILKSGPPESKLYSPLFIMNDQSEIFNYSDLYIRGLGKNPGYHPSDDVLNLTVEGTGSGSLISPIFKNLITTLSINGVVNFSASYYNVMPLYMEVIDGYSINANSALYIDGINPPISYNSIPLIIYKTSLTKTISLYVHGF